MVCHCDIQVEPDLFTVRFGQSYCHKDSPNLSVLCLLHAGVNEWRGASHSAKWSPAPLPLPQWHRECQVALWWLVPHRVRIIPKWCTGDCTPLNGLSLLYIYISRGNCVLFYKIKNPNSWMQSYPSVIWRQVSRLMVSGHHLQQEVLLPGCNLQRRHRGNDRGRDQRPDQSTQRGTTIGLVTQSLVLNTRQKCILWCCSVC